MHGQTTMTAPPVHVHNNPNGQNNGQISASPGYGNAGADSKPGVVQPGSRLIGNVRLWLRVSFFLSSCVVRM